MNVCLSEVISSLPVVSGFLRDVEEILRFSGLLLSVEWWFCTDVSEQSLGSIFKGQEVQEGNTGPIGCPEKSVENYHSTLRNIPEERRPLLLPLSKLKFFIHFSSASFILRSPSISSHIICIVQLYMFYITFS
jgi:hypothetical protein